MAVFQGKGAFFAISGLRSENALLGGVVVITDSHGREGVAIGLA